jgi:hypothetical protein
MKTKVLKAVKTISYKAGVKVFYEEVKEAKGRVKQLKKEDIIPALYGIYDLTSSIKEGDIFKIEG